MIISVKNKKFIMLVFIISMVFVCAYFISCGDTPNDNPNIPANNNNADNTAENIGGGSNAGEEIAAASPKIEPDLPEMDFGGEIINFLVRSEIFNWYWCSWEIYAESETGEPLNDAVYRRNRYVEDKYNFEIKEYRANNPLGDATKAAQSGDNSYHVFMLGISEQATMAQNGHIIDLFAMPHINLSRPWWNQRAVEQLNLGGKLYYALSDISTQDNDAIFVTFFNKKLLADYALDDPYHLVKTGGWTLDKFNEMITDVSRDLNGDGIMNEDDLFGQLGESLGAYMLFVGAGGRITSNNSENFPELTINSERTSAVINKLLVNMGDKNLTLIANDYSGKYNNPWDDLTRPMFKNNQGLFYTIGMGTGDLMRDMDSDYGVLPLPKLDASQNEYYCPVSQMAIALSIPVTNNKTEFTGLAAEAITAESMYTVTEAYYSVNFEHKNLRDEESIEMMKIILASGSYDLGYMFNFGGLVDIFEVMARKNENTFASEYDKRAERAQRDIEKIIEKFR